MKRNLIIILASLLSLNFLISCVATSVVEDINNTAIGSGVSGGSKSEYLKMGIMAIVIRNSVPNITLLADSIEVCNVLISNPNEEYAKKGSIKLYSNGDIALPVQEFTPWAPIALPSGTSGSYIKMHGKLLSYLENGAPLPLFEGVMYTPLHGTIYENLTTEITIELYDNSPLYCIIDGKLEKALVPIDFEIGVKEWE